MSFYDEFSLIDHFDQVCGIIADFVNSHDFFQELDARATEMTIPCDMQFQDIDEWWQLDVNGTNFMTLYLEALDALQKQDEKAYQDHFEVGIEQLKSFPTLYNHFGEKMRGARNPEAEMIRYLPHKVAYVYDYLLELSGVRKLNDAIRLLGNVDMNIVLTPTKNADHIHDGGAYDLVIVLESNNGTPLASRFSSSAPKLH